MNWTDCRIVAFDTETTGLQSYNDDRIVEFGAVELFVNSELHVERVVHHPFLIFPECSIPREASNVSGIYDKDTELTLNFSEYQKEFNAFLLDVSTSLPNHLDELYKSRSGIFSPVHRGDQAILIKKVNFKL